MPFIYVLYWHHLHHLYDYHPTHCNFNPVQDDKEGRCTILVSNERTLFWSMSPMNL